MVDPSFLELVRLGVRRADDPAVTQTLPVVDRELAVDTPSGRFWHRYSYDGYGETPDGRRRADAARASMGRPQFIRLAWSIDAGRPVERPAVESCRYGGPCRRP